MRAHLRFARWVATAASVLTLSVPTAFAQQQSDFGYSLGASVAASPAAAKPRVQYTIKPSDVSLPADVPLGKYRRIIEPYRNWTLICDENLAAKTRVCNVSQKIVDAQDAVVFSWTLAASRGGDPAMILRVPATWGANANIELSFADGLQPIKAVADQCDDTICMAVLSVGVRLRAAISAQSAVTIIVSAPGSAGTSETIPATFDGLSDALSGIG